MLSFVIVLGGAARRHIRRTGLSATLCNQAEDRPDMTGSVDSHVCRT